MKSSLAAIALVAAALVPLVASGRVDAPKVHLVKLAPPQGALSKAHSRSFTSFSFEPAFWTEFFGEPESPNKLTLSLLARLTERGAQPIIRPGGITMDSMIYDPKAKRSVVRTTSATGGVYRTTIGPGFYRSWDNFPAGTGFVSTLNFGNNSYQVARDLAAASYKLQGGKIRHFELGNEPTNYPTARWHRSTAAYVAQWKDWTTRMGRELGLGSKEWWASSATTDKTGLEVRPAALIPAGIDSANAVGEYSIHSYPFATCDAARNKQATIANMLNHTHLVDYADKQITPSARAALKEGKGWVIGEYNSVACSGKPGVTDRFAQALWTVVTDLIYAKRNASAVFQHQGATLVFQSSQQSNTAGEDGSPGFSAYNVVYPVKSSKWGAARVNPSFVGQLFVAEAVGTGRVASLATSGGEGERLAAYAIYGKEGEGVRRVALINLAPVYANDADVRTVEFDVGGLVAASARRGGAWVKRMTAPSVDEKDSGRVRWAGQSFAQGEAVGEVEIERVARDGKVRVRGSEAVLVFFYDEDVYRG
ncbi:hypothetical protein ACQY0O_005041 [Thecaphora frezii]